MLDGKPIDERLHVANGVPVSYSSQEARKAAIAAIRILGVDTLTGAIDKRFEQLILDLWWHLENFHHVKSLLYLFA
jgi:hypothetical protein